MRILQINNHHRFIGGSEVVFFNTSALLRNDRQEVLTFAAASDQDLPSLHECYFPTAFDGSKARLLDIFQYIHNKKAAESLADLIDAEGPFDAAHLHIYYGRLTAAILPVLRDHSIPIVQTLHEYKLACPVFTMEHDGQICDACVGGSTFNLLKNRCKKGSLIKSVVTLMEFWGSRWQGDISYIDRFICISDFQRRVMERAGLPSDRLVTLHNFVEPIDIISNGRQEYLLFFGRIENLKGIHTLIAAAKRLGAQLRIAGIGSEVAKIKAEISDTRNINYLGFVSGMALKRLIAEARCVVVPSEWNEPFGLTVIEAKAAGTPVIGSKIGGITELIKDGVDGFLFDPGNVDDLVCAIKKLESTDIENMGRVARADYQKRFTPKIHLNRLYSIYDSVM